MHPRTRSRMCESDICDSILVLSLQHTFLLTIITMRTRLLLIYPIQLRTFTCVCIVFQLAANWRIQKPARTLISLPLTYANTLAIGRPPTKWAQHFTHAVWCSSAFQRPIACWTTIPMAAQAKERERTVRFARRTRIDWPQTTDSNCGSRVCCAATAINTQSFSAKLCSEWTRARVGVNAHMHDDETTSRPRRYDAHTVNRTFWISNRWLVNFGLHSSVTVGARSAQQIWTKMMQLEALLCNLFVY